LSLIENLTLQFKEVKGVHDVIIHNYGETTVLSLHIEVDEKLSFIDAHKIAEKVDKILRQEINAHVTVHFDPVMERTPSYKLVENLIQEFCQYNPEYESFHDLRVYGKDDKFSIRLDLVVSQNIHENDYARLVEQCKDYIMDKIPQVKKVLIKIEPKFAISRRSRHN
jgi:divalent metal cation (Fe/Co/Zn/Cd) transporter